MNLISKLLGFSGTGQGLLIIALLWCLSIGVVGFKAYGMGEAACELEVLQQKEEIRKVVDSAREGLAVEFSGIIGEYLKDKTVIEVRKEKVLVQVPKYITKEVDSKCVVNNGFVDIHDSVVKQKELPPITDSTFQNSGIPLSEVASKVEVNYSNCLENSKKLEALQKEVVAYKAKLEELKKDKGFFDGLFGE